MGAFARKFEQPDDTTRFPNGCEQVIKVKGVPVGLATLEPGWRWSNDLRPLMGTESCPVYHTGYCLSGNLHVEMDDGSTLDIGPGDVFSIPPGHDGWVVGSEPCVFLDWSGKSTDATEPVAATQGGAR